MGLVRVRVLLFSLAAVSILAPVGAKAFHGYNTYEIRSGAVDTSESFYGDIPVQKTTASSSNGAVGRATIDADAVVLPDGNLRWGAATATVSGSTPADGGTAGGMVRVGYNGINHGATPIPYSFSVSVDASSSGDAAAGASLRTIGPGYFEQEMIGACTIDPAHFPDPQCRPDEGPTASGSVSRSGVLEPGEYVQVSIEVFAGTSHWPGGPVYSGSANASIQVAISVGPPVGARFDWSIPDRYGSDLDGDGRIDSYEPDGPLDPTPDGFRVDFTDGYPERCNRTLTRHWYIDSVQVTPADPRAIEYDPSSCEFSYAFPAEGAYEVALVVQGGGITLEEVVEEVVVQDWVIVSLGDSVASGEGNPEIPMVGWQNYQCHRSALAGPARAAHILETVDPHTSVTFVHLACSGATMDAGILGSYVGQEPGLPLPPQVVAMRELLGDREIDAVTVSIGANDVRFAELVETCFLHGDLAGTLPCDLPGHAGSSRSAFDARVPLLGPLYDEMGSVLASEETGVARDRVYITEYFDPTRDDQGELCDQEILEELADLPPVGISLSEAGWASIEMMPTLNAVIQAAKARNGWNYVGGILSRFGTHGYCAADRWVVQLTESFPTQGDRDGTLHPNVPGHGLYGDRIYEALLSDLYVGGDLSSPRAPA